MRHIKFAAIGTALLLSLAACGGADKADNGGADAKKDSAVQATDLSGLKKVDSVASLVPDKVKADGKLLVGNNISYAPAEFFAPDGKTPQGYDIDLTAALAKVMGLKPVTENAEFAAIIPAIGGKYELGIANFSINQERLKTVNMLQYFEVGSQWSVKKGNPKKFDPASPCGKAVGVQTGTVQDESIDALNEKCPADKKIQIQRMEQQSSVTTAVVGGKVDAMYTDSSVADYVQKLTNGQAEPTGKTEDMAGIGIAIAKNDEQMTKATQAALKYLIENGYLEKIFKTWGITDGLSKEATLNPGA